jgi:hypothetical protein
MGTAGFTATLNRRHKAVLFATLVCAGIILLAGGGIGPGLGSIFLGVALAVGSNSRLVHWLFVAAGLLLLVTPPLYFWHERRALQAKSAPDFIPDGGDQVDKQRGARALPPPVLDNGLTVDQFMQQKRANDLPFTNWEPRLRVLRCWLLV